MKTCNQLRDLEQFGIKLLTGEADTLGYRILCDLDEQGVRVFKECFGMPLYPEGLHPRTGLAENWNSGSIASVMLTGHELVPLAIMGFYLQGYDVVVTKYEHGHEQVFALEKDDNLRLNEEGSAYEFRRAEKDLFYPWPDCHGEIIRIIRQRKSDGQVVQGTRNVHQMSGRVS